MAKNNKSNPLRNRFAIFGLILLLIGIIFAISEVKKQQNIRQEAAGKPVASSNTQSFESTFGGWTPDQYSTSKSSINGKITRSKDRAHHGKYSLLSSLNGFNTNETIWVERQISVKPNTLVNVDISFYLWGQPVSEVTNGWTVFAYTGIDNPETQNDFTPIGQTDTAPEWKKYTYNKTFLTNSTGRAWVAFGLGSTTTEQRMYYLDFAKVQITPQNNSTESIAPKEPTVYYCGGIAGKQCPNGYDCRIKENYPDASGICVKIK